MLSNTQINEIHKIVESSLDKSEHIWNQTKGKLKIIAMESANSPMTSVNSNIPGYEIIQNDMRPEVDEFIALVADMRDSSKHLLQEISPKKAKVSRLQRVYFETSALLPALNKTIEYNNGSVTEYLGDGILALFRVDPDNRKEAIYNAFYSAESCILETRAIVNEHLKDRYNLQELHLGVGLAISKAIITVVGLEDQLHGKIIGECIYRATKLSGGNDLICIDEQLKAVWPKNKGGVLSFKKTMMKEVHGFLLSRKQK